jgi:hypothetical protein
MGHIVTMDFSPLVADKLRANKDKKKTKGFNLKFKNKLIGKNHKSKLSCTSETPTLKEINQINELTNNE